MKNFLEKFQKKGPADRKSNRAWQKNKRGDSKVESNDSPEIPNRGETSDISGLPSGDQPSTFPLGQSSSAHMAVSATRKMGKYSEQTWAKKTK